MHTQPPSMVCHSNKMFTVNSSILMIYIVESEDAASIVLLGYLWLRKQTHNFVHTWVSVRLQDISNQHTTSFLK